MDDGGVSADDGGESSESSAAETGAPMDSPYEGGWDIGGCQSDIGPANNQVGGILEDFTFTDQFGDQVRLYDFCHKAVLIAEGAFW
jgi:cytochrome oxidase Cu insertion factor (SCO1/SenC/PrrC family)